jgi:redox-sensitive bicupin YhaK (pirin superfamily)
MIELRKSDERGRTSLDWLDSRHSFSFGGYHDPAHAGFGVLRVINEDRVAPAGGFGTHPHRDMEILTWVLDGSLRHRDTLGNGSVIGPGDLQRMTAGRGILHSELNASNDDPVHFLQIWIEPERLGLEPGYEQQSFPRAGRLGALRRIAGGDGAGGALRVHQRTALYAGALGAGDRLVHEPVGGRRVWVQVTSGRLELNGLELSAGDGVALAEEPAIEMRSVDEADLLLFDLP